MTTKEALGSLRLSCSPSEDCRGCVNVQSCEHKKAYAVLTTMAEDYEKAKAEREELQEQYAQLESSCYDNGFPTGGSVFSELEKAEADLEKVKAECEEAKKALIDSCNDEMAELRAEVERLKKLICSGDNEQARLFLHQAGVMAELATDRCRLIAEGNCLKARAEKAETELESERAALACRDPEREKKEGL